MSNLSYKEFRTKLRREIWPRRPGEAANLVEVHDAFFSRAMTELARWVPCLQANNTNVFRACATYLDCSKTFVESPIGDIRRVYTIVNGDWCSKIEYFPATYENIVCKSRSMDRTLTLPENVGYDALPHGSKRHEAVVDSVCGRAAKGWWAQYRHRFYVWPFLQSNESLVIEWDGWKQSWAEDDQIDDEQWDEFPQEAVKLGVRYKHEDQFGCDRALKKELRKDYEDALADAIYWCRRRIEEPHHRPCDEQEAICPLVSDIAVVPDETTVGEETVIVANVGDFRRTGNPVLPGAGIDVATLVASWGPAYVISNGDNVYTGTYEEEVEPLYGDFIGEAVEDNRFWPALGNHDYQDGGLDNYFNFFKIPDNRTYYTIRRGLVQWFFISNEVWEVDGRAANSEQAQWLRIQLATSNAIWKVVVMQNAPYTSGVSDTPGATYARWPYKEWGADLVVSGDTHSYERYEVNGFPYIVNGAGGAVMDIPSEFGPVIDDPFLGIVTKARHELFGAVRFEIKCLELKIQFIGLDYVVKDELILTKTEAVTTKPTTTEPVDVVHVDAPVFGNGYFFNNVALIHSDSDGLWHVFGLQLVDGHPVPYLHDPGQEDYDTILPTQSQSRFKNGWFTIKNDTDGLWYNLGSHNQDGSPVLYFVEPGLPEDAPTIVGEPTRGRFFNGEIQVKNETDGEWYAIRCQTVDGFSVYYLEQI